MDSTYCYNTIPTKAPTQVEAERIGYLHTYLPSPTSSLHKTLGQFKLKFISTKYYKVIVQ